MDQQHDNHNFGRFDLNEIATSFPPTAETLLIDTYPRCPTRPLPLIPRTLRLLSLLHIRLHPRPQNLRFHDQKSCVLA